MGEFKEQGVVLDGSSDSRFFIAAISSAGTDGAGVLPPYPQAAHWIPQFRRSALELLPKEERDFFLRRSKYTPWLIGVGEGRHLVQTFYPGPRTGRYEKAATPGLSFPLRLSKADLWYLNQITERASDLASGLSIARLPVYFEDPRCLSSFGVLDYYHEPIEPVEARDEDLCNHQARVWPTHWSFLPAGGVYWALLESDGEGNELAEFWFLNRENQARLIKEKVVYF